jgi:rhomboid protease GluP
VDQNIFLIMFVGISCGVTLFRALMSPWRRYVTGWIVVPIVILVITGLAYFANPDYAGLIGGVLWLLFVLTPSLGSRWAARLILQQRFTEAQRWARVLAILHPFDDWQVQPEIARALALAQQGKASEAVKILRRYENNNSTMGASAKLQLYRLQNRWAELVAWLERSPDLAANPAEISAYIRALGEIGDPNRIIASYMHFRDVIGKAQLAGMVSLSVFAFAGQREPVVRLFAGPLHLYPPELQKYWLGLADLAAGDPDRAREELTEAATSADFNVSNAARHRLDHPLPVAQNILTPESRQALAEIEREVDQDLRFGRAMHVRRTPPYATYALIAANVIVFAVEMSQGSSTDLETLFRMGALVPTVVVRNGEWWRLLAAMFLHYGFLHLAANMIALLVIGPFVEFVVGIPQYLLTYFVSGLGSMLLIVGLTEAHLLRPDEILVGASGAIMGLIGAMGAIMYRGWRVEKAPVAGQRLRQILAIVLLQVFIDMAIPASSLQGHLGGAIIGFVVASLLRHHVQAQPSPAGNPRQ